MSVQDNVAFGPRSKKVGPAETDRRVKELLGIVRLGHLANRKPGQLSGGAANGSRPRMVNYPALSCRWTCCLDLKLRQAMQIELSDSAEGITFIT